ncbi:MAG: DUF1330 domain-containing protein [Hyphomicrobiaceae bacterium]
MSVYLIAQIIIHDADEYKKYTDEFRTIIMRYGGAVVARGLPAEIIEGEWPFPRTILLKFRDGDGAKRWYADADYQRIVQHRFKSSRANLVVLKGTDDDF